MKKDKKEKKTCIVYKNVLKYKKKTKIKKHVGELLELVASGGEEGEPI